MGNDPTFDLLAFADRLGEPSGEAADPGAGLGQGPAPDGPMTPEQAEFLSHLLRRSGHPSVDPAMTFAGAKARIAELLDELR